MIANQVLKLSRTMGLWRDVGRSGGAVPGEDDQNHGTMGRWDHGKGVEAAGSSAHIKVIASATASRYRHRHRHHHGVAHELLAHLPRACGCAGHTVRRGIGVPWKPATERLSGLILDVFHAHKGHEYTCKPPSCRPPTQS